MNFSKMTPEQVKKEFPIGEERLLDGKKVKLYINQTGCGNLVYEDIKLDNDSKDEFNNLWTALDTAKVALKATPTDGMEDYIRIVSNNINIAKKNLSDWCSNQVRRLGLYENTDFDGNNFFIALWHTDKCKKGNM